MEILIGNSLHTSLKEIESIFNNGHEFLFADYKDISEYQAKETDRDNYKKYFEYEEVKPFIKYKCNGILYPSNKITEFGATVTTQKLCITNEAMLKSGLYEMLGEEKIALIDIRSKLRPCKIYKLLEDKIYIVPESFSEIINGYLEICFWELSEISRN